MKKYFLSVAGTFFWTALSITIMGCRPSPEESRFVKKEGVYGTISDAMSNKNDCHTLIIRNLRPDGSVKSQIQKLSSDIGELKNLKKLFIYGLPTQKTPDYFNKLKSLEELHIIYSVDREKPSIIEGLEELPRLKVVKLEDVVLDYFPRLPASVRILSLKSNRLEGKDLIAIKPNSIENLNLAFNPISSLPKDFSVSFKNLRSLNLGYCHLKNFPKPVLGLSELHELGMANNDISVVPNELDSLTQLTKIDFFNCPVKRLPYTLSEMTNLKTLWLPSTVDRMWLDSLTNKNPDIDIMISTYKGL